MSESAKPAPGTIAWTDLTVNDAERVRDFYSAVVGWAPEPVSMDGYEDFCMNAPSDGTPVAGVCHARGANAGLPPQWLVYVVVEDLDQACARCRELGGKIVAGPKGMGSNRYCVIEDPAGAVCALVQPGD